MQQRVGVVAWCGFEYLSERNPVEGVKTPGVMDVFRIPKLGATFYQADAGEGVLFLYGRDKGLWYLSGSAVGPLSARAREMMKEAFGKR